MVPSTTTVELDREVVKQAKILAAEQGTTLKALVEVSLLAYLTRWPKGGTRPHHKDVVKSS